MNIKYVNEMVACGPVSFRLILTKGE